MRTIRNWLNAEVEIATSAGGVVALADAWQNFVRGGVTPWPTPELIQKLYQSRQARAFKESELAVATRALGFYSDLQSLHSEDAITWSVFGPIAYAEPKVRGRFVEELLRLVGVSGAAEGANVWLWRRLPHPDTLVPGGPEIDFGVQTSDVFLLGEAKWRSSVAATQGVERNKDQFTLRREFCSKYGRRILPEVKHFVVLGVSWRGGLIQRRDSDAEGVALHSRDITWDQIAAVDSHPCSAELRSYIAWKKAHSLTV